METNKPLDGGGGVVVAFDPFVGVGGGRAHPGDFGDDDVADDGGSARRWARAQWMVQMAAVWVDKDAVTRLQSAP